jgi:chromosomal replication initiation ATPase DnaA
MKQFLLPFDETPSYAAEDFCEGPSNELARTWLEKPEGWTNGRMVLWGESGCGKTHLLHIWAAAHGAEVHQGPGLRGFSPPPDRPVAVDDADAAADEPALLHLLNAARESGQPVLLTAGAPPSRQNLVLPDLASRLRGSLAVGIGPADDAMLAALLARLAAARQLSLDFRVQNFLTSRLPRSPAAYREAILRLDRTAMASGAKISRALAASVLADLASPEPPEDKLLQTRHFRETEDLL